jgi:hypothetical protein
VDEKMDAESRSRKLELAFPGWVEHETLASMMFAMRDEDVKEFDLGRAIQTGIRMLQNVATVERILISETFEFDRNEFLTNRAHESLISLMESLNHDGSPIRIVCLSSDVYIEELLLKSFSGSNIRPHAMSLGGFRSQETYDSALSDFAENKDVNCLILHCDMPESSASHILHAKHRLEAMVNQQSLQDRHIVLVITTDRLAEGGAFVSFDFLNLFLFFFIKFQFNDRRFHSFLNVDGNFTASMRLFQPRSWVLQAWRI